MKLLSIAVMLSVLPLSAYAATPTLELNGFKIGEGIESVQQKAENDCLVVDEFKEDGRAAEKTKEIFGDTDKIIECIKPQSQEIPIHKMLFEFQNKKLVTIFADIEDGNADSASLWLKKHFGDAEEESNSYSQYEFDHKHEQSEVHFYYANRTALLRQRINGSGDLRTFLYVMDGNSQKISPINAPYFR